MSLVKTLAQLDASGLSSARVWQTIARLDERNLSGDEKAAYQILLGEVLNSLNYPVLATHFYVEGLKAISQPAKVLTPWRRLSFITHKRPVSFLMDDLAELTRLHSLTPPALGGNWHYAVGRHWFEKSKYSKAIEHFSKVRIQDKKFLATKYYEGLSYVEMNQEADAEKSFRTMLNGIAGSALDSREKDELLNLAKLALARLYYQQKKFQLSILFYRSVDRESEQFFNALFEQSWAFFLASYPNHALGMLHAVDSPFYSHIFTPEASILRAIIYYWMCRYDDARSAIQQFDEKYRASVASLTRFLARTQLSNETAYTLYENFITGVSSSALGMDRAVLQTAARNGAMRYNREEYAFALDELNRWRNEGIRGAKPQSVEGRLEQIVKRSRHNLGRSFIVSLQDLLTDYKHLEEQTKFLEIELLMSKKEQLLGRELHNNKITNTKEDSFVGGWANEEMTWAPNRLNEYWLDEIGYHIVNTPTLCK